VDRSNRGGSGSVEARAAAAAAVEDEDEEVETEFSCVCNPKAVAWAPKRLDDKEDATATLRRARYRLTSKDTGSLNRLNAIIHAHKDNDTGDQSLIYL
jgi:hypothetical protein